MSEPWQVVLAILFLPALAYFVCKLGTMGVLKGIEAYRRDREREIN